LNIEFCHLSNIEIADIISLLTNDRVLKHMPLAKDSLFDEKQCLAWVKGKKNNGKTMVMVLGHF